MSSALIDTLNLIQYNIILYAYSLWLIFGCTGCLLNLIVFSRPHLRKASCSIYFFAASLDHLMTLLIGISPVLYSLNFPNPQIQSLLFCKLRGYLFQICLMLSRWYVAFACIDRYASTSDKVRLRNFARSQIAYRVLIIVAIVWSFICTHRLIFYGIQGNLCGIVNNMGAALYHSAYVIIGGAILPTLIMIICACLIRRNLVEKERRRTQLASNQTQQQRKQRTLDNQILKILLIQIIFYIIFITPQVCNLIFNTVSLVTPNHSNNYLAVVQFVSFVAECVLYLFPVTSFYLYTLTSKTFRKELLKYFVSIHLPCPRTQIFPSLNTTMIDHHPQEN